MSFPNFNNVLSALAASTAASIAAIPIFVSELNALLNIATYTWAPVWAMTILELDVRVTLSAATKSILSAWFGAGTGILCFYLATLVFEDSLYKQHAIALVFMIPFTSIIRMSYPDTQSFLVHVFRWDVGLICAYLVAGFGKTTTTWSGISIALGFTIGAVSAFLLAVCNRVFRPYARKPRLLSTAIAKFRIAHTVWFEALVDCMYDSTKDHNDELTRRQNEANDSFRELQSLVSAIRSDFVNQVNDPSVLNAVYRASATVNVFLFAIRGAMSHDALKSNPITRILTSEMKCVIQGTKLAMSTMLLPNGNSNTSLKPIRIPTPLFGDDLVRTIEEEEEMTRLVFILTCINDFQGAIRNFVSLVDKFHTSDIYFVPRHKSISNYAMKTIKNLSVKSILPKTGYIFLIKSALTNEILAQGLVALQYHFPQFGIASYFGWAVVGYLVTFLPTCGEAIVRGSRRALGTLIGSGLTAIVAVSTDEVSHLSAFLIMIIIVFLGKLSSYHPWINNAGLVFALCQLFEILPNLVSDNGVINPIPRSELLYAVLYRTACMCIGVGYSMLTAILIYPYYSSNRVRQIFSKSVKSISLVLQNRLSRHYSGHSRSDLQMIDGLSDSDISDLAMIFGGQKALPEAAARAISELFILSRRPANKVPFKLVNIIKAETALYRVSTTTFIVSLVISYSSKKTNESEEIWNLIRDLINTFDRCVTHFANMIEFPEKSASALSRECTFDWSSRVSEIYTRIRTIDDIPLHNVVFALTELFSAWDELIMKIDPILVFKNSRALSGINSGRSVRLSLGNVS